MIPITKLELAELRIQECKRSKSLTLSFKGLVFTSEELYQINSLIKEYFPNPEKLPNITGINFNNIPETEILTLQSIMEAPYDYYSSETKNQYILRAILTPINYGLTIDDVMEMGIGNTAFHKAAKIGDVERVRAFIYTEIDVDKRNNNNDTALHIAASNENAEVCEVLIKAGANVKAENNRKEAPCDSEIVQNIVEKIKNILEREREEMKLEQFIKDNPNYQHIKVLQHVLENQYGNITFFDKNSEVLSTTAKQLNTDDEELQRDIDEATILVNRVARLPDNNTSDMSAMSEAQHPKGAETKNYCSSDSNKKPAAKKNAKMKML